MREGKARLALAALAAFLMLALALKLPLSVAGLVALLILVIGKVLHIDEVYRAIEWKTVFLVAGLIPAISSINQHLHPAHTSGQRPDHAARRVQNQ